LRPWETESPEEIADWGIGPLIKKKSKNYQKRGYRVPVWIKSPIRTRTDNPISKKINISVRVPENSVPISGFGSGFWFRIFLNTHSAKQYGQTVPRSTAVLPGTVWLCQFSGHAIFPLLGCTIVPCLVARPCLACFPRVVLFLVLGASLNVYSSPKCYLFQQNPKVFP